MGVDTTGWAHYNADQYYGAGSKFGLVAFPNGGPNPPTANDIVVFKGEPAGHVAVVTSVTSAQVNIIEQNWSYSGTASLVLSSSNGGYTVSRTGSAYVVLGWLRLGGISNNPLPVITQLNPPSLPIGAPPQTLTISGTGFLASSTVTLNGIVHTPAFVSASQLTISLTAADLATAGSFPVVVTNPAPGGGLSNSVNFAVIAAPVSVTVSPATAQVVVNGLQQFTATVTNTSNTAVTWSVNGATGGNSTVGTVSGGGLYTAPAAVPSPATVTVTATTQATPTATSSASVTIGPYTETPTYSFTSLTDGAAPSTALIQGTDGDYYGTAQLGGASGEGTAFKVDSSGNVTSLHEFAGSDGANPVGALVLANDGNFYGTTQWGGASGDGTIFKMDSSGDLTTLYSFTGGNDGAEPVAGLIQGSDGYLYGTAWYGGTNDLGTVFKIDLSGNLTTLYSFAGGDDGEAPWSALIQAQDGYYYGTTSHGGAFSFGTIFKIDSAGNLTTLYSFTGGTDGGVPSEALLQANDGFFYGTTLYDGDASCSVSNSTGCGTVFKVDSSGNFTVLHDFSGGADGGVPFSSVIQASDGDFYGTTVAGGDPSCSVYASNEDYSTYIGCGTVFKMDLAGNLSALYSFTGSPSDGSNSFSTLLEGSDGFFYGTTRWGGTDSTCPYTTNGGCGTVFKVSGPGGPLTPLIAPQIRHLGQRLPTVATHAPQKITISKAPTRHVLSGARGGRGANPPLSQR